MVVVPQRDDVARDQLQAARREGCPVTALLGKRKLTAVEVGDAQRRFGPAILGLFAHNDKLSVEREDGVAYGSHGPLELVNAA